MMSNVARELLFRKARPPGSRINPFEPGGTPRVGLNSPARGVTTGVYSATIYPNGEFGIGRLAQSKKSVRDKLCNRKIIDGYKIVEIPREHELADGTKLLDPYDCISQPVKLDSAPESSQPKRKYGGRGITAYGKKMVRNGAYLVHTNSDKSRRLYPQFSTLTLPSFSPEVERGICENWGYIVRRFFEECTREAKRNCTTFDYVSVTEIQPERWKNRKEVGLHLHFIYNAEFIKWAGTFVLTDDFIRSTWHRILKGIIATVCETGGIPAPECPIPSYRREKVERSAEGYIGKYKSKGGNWSMKFLKSKALRFCHPSGGVYQIRYVAISRNAQLKVGIQAQLWELLSASRKMTPESCITDAPPYLFDSYCHVEPPYPPI